MGTATSGWTGTACPLYFAPDDPLHDAFFLAWPVLAQGGKGLRLGGGGGGGDKGATTRRNVTQGGRPPHPTPIVTGGQPAYQQMGDSPLNRSTRTDTRKYQRAYSFSTPPRVPVSPLASARLPVQLPPHSSAARRWGGYPKPPNCTPVKCMPHPITHAPEQRSTRCAAVYTGHRDTNTCRTVVGGHCDALRAFKCARCTGGRVPAWDACAGSAGDLQTSAGPQRSGCGGHAESGVRFRGVHAVLQHGGQQ